ncbi:MAG: glycosyltransferase family 4 protein [Promethearchaeota archaeon]
MKITFITPVFPHPKQGVYPGIERFVKNIALSIKDLGHDVKILTTYWNGGKKEDSYRTIPIRRIRDSKSFIGKLGSICSLNYYSFGFNSFTKRNYNFYSDSDIIVLPLAIGFNFIFKLKKIPVVSFFYHHDSPASFRDYLYLPFYDRLIKKQIKRYDNVIIRSDLARYELSKFYGYGDKNISLITSAVDMEKFNPNKKDPKIKDKFGDNILLYLGPFFKRKQIPILLKAMPNVIKEFPNVHLLLIGDGEPEILNYCKNLTFELKIQNNITFLGFVDDEEIPKYYASSDIFVFPSELEGFGAVMIEAMASGTPVICANRKPMSTIVENGGIMFEVNDPKDLSKKIVSLLKNRERITELRENAIEVAKKYDVSNIAKQYIKLFKKILEKQKESSK